MSRQHDSMIYPSVESLLSRVDSKFSLVTLASFRARQINSYFNHLGAGTGSDIPPQVSSVARKPLSIAFEEIAADKIQRIEKQEIEEPAEDELATIDDASEVSGEDVVSPAGDE
jgi:DNA-directed RNA polymerase subunit omega